MVADPNQAEYSRFDRLARPGIHLFGARHHAFHVFGISGFLAGASTGAAIGAARGLSPLIVLGLALLAALSSLALVMITKVITGRETLVYYRHQIAVVAAAWLVLRLFRLPVLPYLDATVIGLGVFLAFGRVGCFMVGCCYGRPSHVGTCYGDEHAEAGFPACFVGKRLFPVQLVEALAALGITALTIAAVLGGGAPGEGLSRYVLAYGLLRFGLETIRGDALRPHALRLSEAQWTALALSAAVVWAERTGYLPPRAHHLWLAAALMAVAAVTSTRRALFGDHFAFTHPRHVEEIAWILHEARGPSIHVARTSLGLTLSASAASDAEGPYRHLAISRKGGAMTRSLAGAIAAVIGPLFGPRCAVTLLGGRPGLYHMIVREGPSAQSASSTASGTAMSLRSNAR